MLDSRNIPLNWRKVVSVLPLLLVYLLITFINYLFLWKYVPEKLYKEEPYCIGAIICRIIFCYFSGMTYVFLTKTFLTNPGYLPRWLRTPITDPGSDHYRVLRVYNMRVWVANKLYTFEEFVEKPEGLHQQQQENRHPESSFDSDIMAPGDIEMQTLNAVRQYDFGPLLPRSCLDELAKSTTPDTPVDINNLNPLEQVIYDMPDRNFYLIADEVRNFFDTDQYWLLNWRYCA